MNLRIGILSLLLFMFMVSASAQKGFSVVEKKADKKIEILYDGKLLTAYCYFDSTEKPVLFPVKTLTGNVVTRGFPIAPRAGSLAVITALPPRGRTHRPSAPCRYMAELRKCKWSRLLE